MISVGVLKSKSCQCLLFAIGKGSSMHANHRGCMHCTRCEKNLSLLHIAVVGGQQSFYINGKELSYSTAVNQK